MLPPLPPKWEPLLRGELEQPYFRGLDGFLAAERSAGKVVLPALGDVFHALQATPPDAVKVVLLGQDPYPTPGHAHGLCFSVRPEVRPLPGSLRNIYKELRDDLGIPPAAHGCLESWARQGVLLLNTVLTVRAGEANSHRKRGWESFTDAILDRVDALPHRVVFLLWGRPAQAKRIRIRNPHHRVIECAHPSPLSARLFLGCRCFSATNRLLEEAGAVPVDWRVVVP
ncbi:MAG: uracil-DNA glycosylase [Verrucomicrobiales bacterium]|nr:uracil-DNA glycosylase [Verrucomicrobiales bacterium]